MLGNLGFSYIGLIFLLMLFIPNIFWIFRQPDGYKDLAKNENKVLLVFERVGQVAVVVCALIFSNYNPSIFNGWTTWLIVAFALMLIYEIAWVRYFVKPTLKNFYGHFLFIPIPLASLPIISFLLLGIYGKVLWLLLAVIFLAIGHMGIHIQHNKKIQLYQ